MRKAALVLLPLLILMLMPIMGNAATVTEDYIDAQSNIDSVADLGTHDVFNDLKATDSTYDLMTEYSPTASGSVGANVGSGSSTRSISASGCRGTYGEADVTGTISTGYAYLRGSVSMNAKMFITDSSDVILTNGVSTATAITTTAQTYTFTWTTPPSVTVSNAYHVYVIGDTTTLYLYYYNDEDGVSYYDSSNNYATPTNPTDRTQATDLYRQLYCVISPSINYRLALEMSFTSVNLGYDVYKLAVKTGTHASGSESFNVQIWAAGWSNVLTGLNWSTWNNATITAYKASTIYVQFVGQTETGDGTQDTINIDSILLVEIDKVWNVAATAPLYFQTEQYTLPLEGFLILLGLVLIPVSTVYLVRGGRESLSNDKIFFFFLVFFVGWALFLGGIMP